MKRKAGKITALALAAAMSVSMLPAAAFADSDDGLTTIRIMGINNTVTTVDGGTVSLQDWIDSGESKLYQTFTDELAKRGLKPPRTPGREKTSWRFWS